MKKLRKFLTVGVMVLSIIAMSGLTVNTANAAAQAGDLIKMDGLSSVYYLGNDGKRYVFPSESVYFSWYQDFSSVVTIPASELQSYPLGANVTMRPGTKLVKITTDPSVYAVTPNGVLRKIQSESDAITLYGTNWAKMVVDVSDAFFTNYSVGSALTSGQYPAGTLLKNANNASIYYFDGTDYRMIASEAAFTANRFSFSNVVTTGMTLAASGSSVTGAEAIAQPTGATSGTVVTGSGLVVALSSDTPAAKTVPSQATGVVMAKYNFTAANDGAINLNSLNLKRTGVGSPSEISKVYLYDGNTRLTNGRTVSSSDNTATFSNIGLTVAAGTTKTVSVVVDVADLTSAGNHAFSIESASAVSASSASVTGSFPMAGNIMSFNTTDVGLVDVEGNNTYTVKAGQTDVELGRFTVYVNNTEDATIKGITLYNNDRDVLSNLDLYRGSDLVATGVKSGSYFNFTLNTPYDVAKGESVAFTIMGDVTGARDGDTANLNVRYNTDVQVMGKTYGYNLKPTAAVNTGSSMIDELSGTQKQAITVEAGQVTITANGPVTSNIAKNSNDVVLMNFTIAAQSAIDVEKVGIIVKDSDDSDDDDLSNAEIVCGNTVMNEWADFTEAAAGTAVTDTSVWSINAGETKTCQIRIDVENTKGSDTISANLDVSNWIFKDGGTGDTISDVVPSADLVGNDMTVVASSLTVTLGSTPAAQIWVKGSTVDVNGYNFAAGDAKDVKVTAISLAGYIDADVSTTFAAGVEGGVYVKDVLSTVELYDGTTKVGTTKTVATDGTVTFNTLSWTVPAGQTKKLTVKSLSSSNAPYGADNDAVKFTVTSVTAEYDNGTGLTPTISAVDGEGEITISQQIAGAGTLAMALDADTPNSDLIVMGNQGVSVTKAKFTTTKEPFIVEKMQIDNDGSADADVTSVTLEYKNEAGATVTNTGYFSAGLINFSGLSVYVPKDESAVVTIKANLNTKDGGATNDNTVALNVTETNFRAVSKNSSTVVDAAGELVGNGVSGNDMYLYETKPSVNFASDTPSGNLNPSANTLLAKISVTADAAKDVSFENGDGNTLKVNISASSAAASTGDLTLKDENGNALDTQTVADYEAVGASATFDFADKSFTVPAGQTKYLYVYGDTSDFTTQGDLIQLVLDDTAGNIDWGINGAGSYNRGNIIFKGDKFGGTFVRP
jgi:hypothetical protein